MSKLLVATIKLRRESYVKFVLAHQHRFEEVVRAKYVGPGVTRNKFLALIDVVLNKIMRSLYSVETKPSHQCFRLSKQCFQHFNFKKYKDSIEDTRRSVIGTSPYSPVLAEY